MNFWADFSVKYFKDDRINRFIERAQNRDPLELYLDHEIEDFKNSILENKELLLNDSKKIKLIKIIQLCIELDCFENLYFFIRPILKKLDLSGRYIVSIEGLYVIINGKRELTIKMYPFLIECDYKIIEYSIRLINFILKGDVDKFLNVSNLNKLLTLNTIKKIIENKTVIKHNCNHQPFINNKENCCSINCENKTIGYFHYEISKFIITIPLCRDHVVPEVLIGNHEFNLRNNDC